MVSIATSRITSSVGIRVALGAARVSVLWMVLREVIVLSVVATLAGYLPARRATRVDPMLALRCE